jgi:signal transduction histidine kinase
MNSKTLEEFIEKWEKLLISIDELERDRMRDDLHDGLGQILTSIAFRLYGLGRMLDEKSAPEVEEIKEISRLVTAAKNELNYLYISSGPALFQEGIDDLAAALRSLSSMAEARLSIPCVFRCDQDVTIGNTITVVQLYRIAQASVTGSARYMKPGRLAITLGKKSGSILLTIECSECEDANKVDIYNNIVIKLLRYRADLINATLEMHEADGGGIVIKCFAPEQNSGLM